MQEEGGEGVELARMVGVADAIQKNAFANRLGARHSCRPDHEKNTTRHVLGVSGVRRGRGDRLYSVCRNAISCGIRVVNISYDFS